MSGYQPTLAEARAQVEGIEYHIAHAYKVEEAGWVRAAEATHWRASSPLQANGYWVQMKKGRRGYYVRWPMSRIDRRCDICGCVLRARRDAGGHGFWFDGRWLTGNPAERDPRCGEYDPRHACLSCFNRVRWKIRRAEEVNENRLMIGRIQREIRRAA
jgi:hypothetical protein